MDILKFVEKFDGNTDVSTWFDQVLAIATITKIENIQLFMPILLKGEAYAVYQHLDDNTKGSLELLRVAMEKAFALDIFTAFERLKERRWMNETVDAYLSDLRTLVKLARASDTTLRCVFVSGLPILASQTLRALPDIETMSWENVVRVARALVTNNTEQVGCATILSPGSRQKSAVDPTRLKICNYCKKQGHLEEQCFRKKRKCWRCGDPDHLERDCSKTVSGNAGGVTHAPVFTPSNQ